MACEIKVMSAIVDKVKELSESGLNSSIEDANRIANDKFYSRIGDTGLELSESTGHVVVNAVLTLFSSRT